MLPLAGMPAAKAVAIPHCGEKSLVRMMRYWVKEASAHDDLPVVDGIAIDETSFRKGRSYEKVMIGGGWQRIIDVEKGRAPSTVEEFSKKSEEKGGESDTITATGSGLFKAYRAGIDLCFPYARHTVDKFHVKKPLPDTTAEVR